MTLLAIWGVAQVAFGATVGSLLVYEKAIGRKRRERIITVKTVKFTKK